MSTSQLSSAKPSAMQSRDWKVVISESFRDIDSLLGFCEIERSDVDVASNSVFGFRVTRYFASLIEKGNPLDPLLLQVLPTPAEAHIVPGYSRDAVGDHLCMPIPGLIHKYHGRVLFALTGACAIHCRYCFRRHFPYAEASVDYKPGSPALKYLAENTDINEVILSGGDPLMMSDEKLADLISNLNRIPHIRLLRIHSRMLSVLPERINPSLIATMGAFKGRVVFVTHINHPNEISARNRHAFEQLSQQGYSLFNQSVLLKQVNDSPLVLAELSHRLFEARIQPYYLHRLDKVQGAAHFDLSIHECRTIYSELRDRLPGYLLPSLVEENAGQKSKTAIHCD